MARQCRRPHLGLFRRPSETAGRALTDWHDWLRRYDRPASAHSQRLRTVQRLIGRRLDRTAPAQVSVLNICAGDGRDLIEVLAEREDAYRVAATLVELDRRLCAAARERATEVGLTGVHVVEGDAGTTATYANVPPADLVILVGVFGNMSDPDAQTTLASLPAFCKPGAIVVWSLRQGARNQDAVAQRRLESGRPRHNDRSRVERIGAWFAAAGFSEVFANRADTAFHVGAFRYDGETKAMPQNHRLFTFDVAEDPPGQTDA